MKGQEFLRYGLPKDILSKGKKQRQEGGRTAQAGLYNPERKQFFTKTRIVNIEFCQLSA